MSAGIDDVAARLGKCPEVHQPCFGAATMNDGDHRDEIVRLEAQIDELAARIESCRKVILAGRIAVMGGGAVLIPMLVSAIQFDPAVIAVAVTAVTPMSAFDPGCVKTQCFM